jgi:hypothetical protein
MRKRCSFFDFGQAFPSRGAAEVINDKVSGHAANESGEPFRLSNISLPDLFKNDPEGFLIEVLSDRGVTNFPADDGHYATAITLDQFGFCLPIAGSDTAH